MAAASLAGQQQQQEVAQDLVVQPRRPSQKSLSLCPSREQGGGQTASLVAAAAVGQGRLRRQQQQPQRGRGRSRTVLQQLAAVGLLQVQVVVVVHRVLVAAVPARL